MIEDSNHTYTIYATQNPFGYKQWSEEKYKSYNKPLYRNQFKCYVAKPVDELLERARLMIVELCHDHPLFEDANKIITEIDKFLVERK